METNGKARFSFAKTDELVSGELAKYGTDGGSFLAPAELPAPAPTGETVSAESSLPASLRPVAVEIATYFRELPRLLAEGNKGRVALIQGDRVVSVWDTFRDAHQAGQQSFGLDPFIAQPINPRDLSVHPPKVS